MAEISINEYVRTIDGYIRKVEQVNRKGSYDGLCHGAYNVDIPYKYSQGISAKKIKSHSPNIIDLIEEGDYIKGEKVTAIYDEYKNDGHIKFETNYEGRYRDYVDEDIKSIVTKEMFASAQYRVETD